MKIVSLQAENLKRITAVEITPTGAMVQITGKNGAGKSSVLDAIFYALAGGKSLPKQPIRKGQTAAKVRLDLGDFIVTRKFAATDSGETTTSLMVEGPNGSRYPSPQHLLDNLMGAIAFDPLQFSRMDAKAQFEMLREISQLGIDLAAIAGQNRTDFEARTDVNRRAKQIRAQADGITLPAEMPDQPVDIDALLTRMTEASRTNSEIERQRVGRENALQQADRMTRQADDLEKEAQGLRDRADALKKLSEAAEALPPPVDVVELRTQIDAGRQANELLAKRARRAQFEIDAKRLEDEAEALTQRMKSRDEAKATALAAAKMPIPDISLGDGVVLYKALPFDQASSAEQLRVSVAIAMSANPKLRVLRIKEGGLLDDDGMQILREMTEAADYQVWIETVHATGPVAVEMVDGAAKVEEAKDAGSLL